MKSKEDVIIAFKQSDTDERVLKSIASDEEHEYDQEELNKALDKTKLVQKEIQVRGKNGQMHTRKQWVKAGEEPSKDKQTKSQDETKDKKPAKQDEKKEHWTKVGSSQEAKAKIAQMLASGKSREELMSEFKNQGVTWKEHEHAGINWMRATMAMNKHLTGVGSGTNASNTDKPAKESNPVGGESNTTSDKTTSDKTTSDKTTSDKTTSEKAKKAMQNQLNAINQKLSNGERNCIMELQKFNSSLQEYVNSAIDESQGIYSEDAINDINEQLSQFTQSLGMSGKLEISLKKDKTMAYVNCTGITKKDNKPHKVMTFYSQDKNAGFWNSARNYEDFLKTQVKNSNLEVKSVIGNDYTQLTTDIEAGTIAGEVHNTIVGRLKSMGIKNPNDRDVQRAASDLRDSSIKTIISSYNFDTISRNLALANAYGSISRNPVTTAERVLKDVLESNEYTREQKCHAIAKLCGDGSEYDFESWGDNVSVRASDGDGNPISVTIEPTTRGLFKVEFTHGDGENGKETYDSIGSVKDAVEKWLKKEENYSYDSSSKMKKAKDAIFSSVKASNNNINYSKETKKAMKEAPVGTTFSVRTNNSYHECYSTYTKTSDNSWEKKYTYPSKTKGKFESWTSSASYSDIWNSINDSMYEVDSVPESTTK